MVLCICVSVSSREDPYSLLCVRTPIKVHVHIIGVRPVLSRNRACLCVTMPSLGEILFIVCGSMLLVGKEELPGLAKVLGRGLGGLVGFMQGARTQFSRLGKANASMETLREEIRNNMADLRQIQSEIQSAGVIRGGGGISAALSGTLHPGSQVRQSQRKTGDTGASAAAADYSISSFIPLSERHPSRLLPVVERDGSQEDNLARLAMAEVQVK